jgi:hypothetical protein
LIFALMPLFLMVWIADAVYLKEWVHVAWIAVFILLLLLIPTGVAKRFAHVLKDRKSPRPPDGRAA